MERLTAETATAAAPASSAGLPAEPPAPTGTPDARAALLAGREAVAAERAAVDFSVDLGRLRLANPVMPASGCFGPELAPLAPWEEIGASVTKTVFSRRRGGNPTHRLAETPFGMINSVGIPSPGIAAFRAEVLPRYHALGVPTVVSVGGLAVDDYLRAVEELDGAGFAALELNVSCPNLEAGGVELGSNPRAVAEVVAGACARTAAPVLVKLTPMVSDIGVVARAAQEAGADAVTVANSFPGLVLDERRDPVLGNTVGGVSGPAIKPLALRLVWQAARAVDIPVVGCGGITDADDVLDFLAAGAAAVQIGTATFARPAAPVEILRELTRRCRDAGLPNLGDYLSSLTTGSSLGGRHA